MSARERILARVRAALPRADGPAAAQDYLKAHAISARPPAAEDIKARFCAEARRLSSSVEEVPSLTAVPRAVAAYLAGLQLPRAAVCWPEFAALEWQAQGIAMEARSAREPDKVGVTGTFCAIAETGTLMTLSGRDTSPAASLLPETHIAILRVAQIVPAMEEAWQRLRNTFEILPRAVNFISGPSRTADIEQTLTLGAHGPYRVHVILLTEGE